VTEIAQEDAVMMRAHVYFAPVLRGVQTAP
jgi:hypothetical protein